MTLMRTPHHPLGEMLLLFITWLVFQPSDCTIKVTAESVEAYSAILRWSLATPANTTVAGFIVAVQADTTMMDNVVIDENSTTSHFLLNLDDMRHYNACVVTRVLLGGVTESGCAVFTTPAGTSTSIAIVSGVFLVLCLIVFGILDFAVSSKRKEVMSHKEEELLEQGWKTFERNSKKKKKGKKRAAPDKPRPDSSVSTLDPTPGDTAV